MEVDNLSFQKQNLEKQVSDSQMLGLQITHQCNARCRPCAFECSPGNHRAMSFKKAVTVLEQVPGMNLNPVIGITGGEPFYDQPLLADICRYVDNVLGYKLTISTNAYWAKTMDSARSVIEEYAQMGLIALLISVDDFHQEFIPLEYVKNLVDAASGLEDFQIILQTIESRNSKKADDYLKALNLTGNEENIRSIAIPCEPVGRAATQIPESEFHTSWSHSASSCSMLRMWIVDPSGSTLPCCGTAARSLPGMDNAFEQPFSDIFHKANADPFLNALAAWGGPFLPFKILSDNGIDTFINSHYASACHACHALFSDTKAVEIVRNKLSEQRVEMMAARLLSWQQQAAGADDSKTNSFNLPAAW